MGEVIKSYKGFSLEMKCKNDKQYEEGKDYEEEKASACDYGMHACEYPLDCFKYYAPANSVFHEVEQSGEISRHHEDSKIASTKMHIGARFDIAGMVKAAIEYTKSRTTMEYTDPEKATAGEYGAATAGNYGAATSRGTSATGKNGLSVARGNNVKVKGGMGAILVIAEEYSDNYNIKEWKVAIVDGVKIKPDTWYCLKNGEFFEVED